MFKKICIFMAALFTMLISCAGPFMLKTSAAASGFPTNYNEFSQYFAGEYSPQSNCKYVFFTFDDSSNNETWAMTFFIQEDKINNNQDNGYYIEYSNNILVVRYNIIANGLDYYYGYDQDSPHVWIYDCYALQLDFNNNTGYVLDSDGTQSCTWRSISSFTFENFDTDLPQYSPTPELDLDVSFAPSLSGSVSRTQILNGKEYTSTTLDMYVSNNGSADVQFSMFIVNHGEDITFPSSVIEDNKGFIGNPVYCYVTDEWSSFTVGMLGNSVYSPCSWHTIASGFQNQIYSIPWNMISLTSNIQYDVVVYACINSTMQQTNTSSMWDMRPVYTVSSNLSDVVEVYRSSFSITDPATFNPNAVDESGTTHSWNPNTDNSNLFNVSSAYRDDNGNIIIRGQTNNSLGDTPFSSGWFDNGSQNINSVFREYFGFLNKAIVLFPPAISVLFGIGLSSIIVIAVIKLLVKG